MFTPSARNPRHAAPKKVVEREERKIVTKAATLCLDGADQIMPATVRDMNKGGARISVANVHAVPDVVMIVVRSEDLIGRARVAWRKQPEIGLKFLRSGDLLQEDRFRREQAAHYQKEQEALQQQQAAMQAQADAARAAEELRQQQMAHFRAQQVEMMGLDPRYVFTEADLKQAYRVKAMKCHPDQGGTMEEFQQLNQVYNALLMSLRPQQPEAQSIAI